MNIKNESYYGEHQGQILEHEKKMKITIK